MARKYILWDHDGVLVDTEPWYYEATRECIAELGYELDLAKYLEDMALGVSAWERAIEAGADAAAARRARAQRDVRYQQFLREQPIEIAGVESVLERLAETYRMAIVTTAKKTDFELIHAERNITRHMAFVLASGDYPRSKPAPDPYLAALQRFGASAEEAVVVEDSARGLAAAVAAGIDCVVVANAFVAAQDLSAATWHIDSLDELPDLLEGLA